MRPWILGSHARRCKLVMRYIAFGAAVVLSNGSVTYAQSICPSTADPIFKYRVTGGHNLIYNYAANHYGYDTWDETILDTWRSTVSFFRAAPGVVSFNMTLEGPPYSPQFQWTMVRDDDVVVESTAEVGVGLTWSGCPKGYTDYGATYGCYLENPASNICPDRESDLGPPKDTPDSCSSELGAASLISEGDPINSATGNHFETVVDYQSPVTPGLVVRRFYNSHPARVTDSQWGTNWRGTFDRAVVDRSSDQYGMQLGVLVRRPDGKNFYFQSSGNSWFPIAQDVTSTLTQISDSAGTIAGWMYLDDKGEIETFSSTGRLLAITDKSGYVQVMTYDAMERLVRVTDSYGRILEFSYRLNIDPNSDQTEIASMRDPQGWV